MSELLAVNEQLQEESIRRLRTELAEVKAQRDKAAWIFGSIKGLVCGEAKPRWDTSFETINTRGIIADLCDEALAAIGEKT